MDESDQLPKLTKSQIKEAHELAVLGVALAEHNRIHGLDLSVIERPEPPDAIISDGKTTTWIELTDVFFSQEWARSVTSYRSVKGHKPMGKSMATDMEEQFAEDVCEAIIKKSSKKSYASCLEEHGPGILVVGLYLPWFGNGSLEIINDRWKMLGSPDISETFSHVYLKGHGLNDGVPFLWNA